MNKKIKTEIAVGIILLFAIVIGGLVYFEGNNETVEIAPVVKQPTVMQAPTASQQDKKISEEVGSNYNNISTDNWELYTDKKDGYSIKYPLGWISDFIDGSSFYVKELQKSGENHPAFGNVLSDNLKNVSGDYFINISVYNGIGAHVNLNEWRSNDGNNYQEVLIKGYETLKFDDKSYMSSTNKNMAGSLRYYFIDKNNNGYEITVWYKDSSNGIGERIISTLDFLN